MYRYTMHKECIAMLLAGGQGSRLTVLTKNIAKPAVSFGGKYRIIDFPLSNCVYSGIDTVGILTLYEPMELNEYIGNGSPWGLNINSGGVRILPPYAGNKKAEWYKGTANAIYQNMSFADKYSPDYVLILSGDHIYKMDYSKMLSFHKEKKAHCTIGVIRVPGEDASRFGILTLDSDGCVSDFCEKPKNPKSNLASMGVYIFSRDMLWEYLKEDENNSQSSHDFGHDIIPRIISDKKRVFGYEFDGYWKDVGTPESLWEANMELLNPTSKIGIWDKSFRVYARNFALPAALLESGCSVCDSIVSEGSVIAGSIENSIISTGCAVSKNAVVKNTVLMPDCVVGEGVCVTNAIAAPGTVLLSDAGKKDTITVISGKGGDHK